MKTDSQKMKERIDSRNRMRKKRAEEKMQLEDYIDLSFEICPDNCKNKDKTCEVCYNLSRYI